MGSPWLWDCEDPAVWAACEAAHDGIVAMHECRKTAALRSAAADAAMKRGPPRFDQGELVAGGLLSSTSQLT